MNPQCEQVMRVGGIGPVYRCERENGHPGFHVNGVKSWPVQCDQVVGGLRCELEDGHPGSHVRGTRHWDTTPAPHADAQEETAVEHLQNLRQMLVNLVQDMRDAQATDYTPLVSWIEQAEAADKRVLKALVQLTRAGRLLAPGVRGIRG